MQAPDALLRGIVLHEVLERFVRETQTDSTACTKSHLMGIAVSVLAQKVPWAEARATWLARLERVSDWFITCEVERRKTAFPNGFEVASRTRLDDLDFDLTATADRIDIDADGRLLIYDYKTGAPPSRKQQTYYDKQLLLEAAIAERSGFKDIPPAEVVKAVYIGLASGGSQVAAPLAEEPTSRIWAEFHDLISTYLSENTGYPSRRAMESKNDVGDYDQLARFGEWDIVDAAEKIRL